MGSLVLPNLPSAWHVDQAILSEGDRVVVIRFGKVGDPDCLRQDDILSKVAEPVKNFAVIYLCDIDRVPEFNQMYELYDPMTIMVCFPPPPGLVSANIVKFFFRNKHIMCKRVMIRQRFLGKSAHIDILQATLGPETTIRSTGSCLSRIEPSNPTR